MSQVRHGKLGDGKLRLSTSERRLSATAHQPYAVVYGTTNRSPSQYRDNNGSRNWAVAVEAALGVGLVEALNPSSAATRALVSYELYTYTHTHTTMLWG
jgi:hypothetical protein